MEDVTASPSLENNSKELQEDSSPNGSVRNPSDKENGEMMDESLNEEQEYSKDPAIVAQMECIAKTVPTTELEIALSQTLERKQIHIERLTNEILKLQRFVSKRKQTYKRKRKDDGAPIRAMSAYNMFIKERFAQLAKENEEALKSDDVDATMKRVPPANLVAKTGNEWKRLSKEEKAKYEERAKADKERYDREMREYQRPDSFVNRKRCKTGYNMFFSAHVLRLKQTESGVPSERGSVARLVGTAWKKLSSADRAYYEQEADRFNEAQEKDGEREVKEEETKPPPPPQQQQSPRPPSSSHLEYSMPQHAEMHMPQMPDHRPHPHYYAHHPVHPYPPYFDYSYHTQRQQQHHHQALAQGYHHQAYPPPRYEN